MVKVYGYKQILRDVYGDLRLGVGNDEPIQFGTGAAGCVVGR